MDFLSDPYFIKLLYGFQSEDSEIETYHFKQEPKSKAGFRYVFPIIETEEVNITMIKAARIFLSACFMAVIVPAASHGAAASPGNAVHATEEWKDDNIMMIEEEPVSDDSGNVTVTMSVADDVSLPVTMVLKGSEGRLSLTVTYDGQSVKMKSGTYRVTKATDGNGEKLDSGAVLTIPERGGEVYLDFHKPDDGGGSPGKNSSCQICSLFRLHSFCMPVIGGIKPISCIDICRKESHAKGK